ncbi:MAG: hypothetical protein A3C92_03520 [Candidatus Sungbacteria bacterium RIFCSPHIGHO2_02_FULL_53_17]|uniref:Addiction module toxin RelE n=1 Tax=Candidatus Sungbacteria bacterium RIFCSPHIGHO2_02_FULL_53_17 TaxID=1802275 RepID=A0A1G2KVU5_9BACT|nr:MAG: hypothetical protein A3C92_03520 [Candidatus Sungbacteria bacterium RIFCSPHIGHO2_02_FULL_53_17]
MNSGKNWVLQIDDAAYRFPKRILRKDAERLLSVIRDLPEDPFRGDIKKMKGEQNVWRRRIGDYRIHYELIAEEKIVHIFLVERRTSHSY